jgi:hypothetical protein
MLLLSKVDSCGPRRLAATEVFGGAFGRDDRVGHPRRRTYDLAALVDALTRSAGVQAFYARQAERPCRLWSEAFRKLLDSSAR